GAKWTRILAYWDQLQPKAPGVKDPGDLDRDGFNDAYVHELDTVVGALRAQHISVILTGAGPPSWARDTAYKKYWTKNQGAAVVRIGDAKVLAAFQKYAKFLAGHFKAFGVVHFEVWNEPNLRLIPQIVGKKVVGPEVYRKMLVAFSKAAHKANPRAVVIAGATSRTGSPGTSPGSTSPQWFAKYLKAHDATRWFNAYSHHPYNTLRSSPQPGAPPRRPDISVTLGNISVLLKLFPTKPFYLTEYCYSTTTGSNDAFVMTVSQEDQARYLRQAYELAGRYKQIKALLWFLVKDWQSNPQNPSSVGVFTGLVDQSDRRKPAWYAFIGGNTITATPSDSSVAAGAPFTVSGVLTTKDVPGADLPVLLQRRSLAGGTWSTVATQPATKTDAAGAYSFSVSQTTGRQYRVIWDGVCESAARPVTLL
ncbi:MAG TPA: cellulase family glycosylhydrolase, partial [Thermoleophilia bacterium]